MSTELVVQPDPRHPVISLTESQRIDIIAKRMSGMQVCLLAREYKVSEVTIWRICKAVKDGLDRVHEEWRERQMSNAINAVNAGLECEEEPYKRGELGVKVLKGLGVYAPDQVNQIAILQAAMPSDWKSEMQAQSGFDEFPVDPTESSSGSPNT